MKHIRAKETRLAIGALAVLVLLAAAVNVPVAVMLSVARNTPMRTGLNVIGPEAAARGWPAATPHTQAWPEPRQRQVDSAWPGHRRVTVWGNPTHQMQSDESGWPLPAVRNVQMWWPWNDPAWAITAQPDPGMRLEWTGVVLNPLLVGGGLWVVLVALPLAAMNVRRASRARRGLCVSCGYPAGASDVCTECGRAVGALGR